MAYTFRYNKIAENQEKDQFLQRLNRLKPSEGYELHSIKYHHNHLQQNKSYFILIQTQTIVNPQQQKIKIRKIIINQKSSSLNQLELNQEHNNDFKEEQIQCFINFKNNLSNLQIEKQKTQDIEQKFQKTFTSRIVSANFLNQNVFMVLSNPFELYFITKKSKSPIKIILDKVYQLQHLVTYFSFQSNDQQKRKQLQNILVFGYDQSTNLNTLLSVNLMTFQIKQIAQSKQYSPRSRKNNFQMFHDDRLYVFGGMNLKNKQIEQLLWSYDIEKGYWFALQMKYKNQKESFQNHFYSSYDSGKIIIYDQHKSYILQIYQCKMTQIQQQNQQTSIEQKNYQNKDKTSQIPIKGIFCFQKKMIFYDKNGPVNNIYKIQKQKL